jgi:hypothetical protein
MSNYLENCIGETSEWYTPPEIFTKLNVTFDLDPCSPGPAHWVPAVNVITKESNGLSHPWEGFVFMNPPFGNRHGHLPWLEKFFSHNNGIAIVRAYTSSGWWHDYMPRADMIVFPRGKTQFIRPDGTVGKSPGHGVALIGMGDRACEVLLNSSLGMVWDRRK